MALETTILKGSGLTKLSGWADPICVKKRRHEIGCNCCFVALSDGRIVLKRWIWNERRARIMAESGVEFILDILIKYHRAMNTIFCAMVHGCGRSINGTSHITI